MAVKPVARLTQSRQIFRAIAPKWRLPKCSVVHEAKFDECIGLDCRLPELSQEFLDFGLGQAAVFVVDI
jgi:hypothetical protein